MHGNGIVVWEEEEEKRDMHGNRMVVWEEEEEEEDEDEEEKKKMGRKGRWLVNKMCLGSVCRQKKSTTTDKSMSSKKRRLGKPRHSAAAASPLPTPAETNGDANATPPPPPPAEAAAAGTPACEIGEVEEPAAETGRRGKNCDGGDVGATVPMPAAVASELAVVSVAEADAAAAAVSSSASREETAAVMIQSAFRACLARRALRALRGLARLESLAGGGAARRQTANARRSMQTLARAQSQVRSRRVMLLEDTHSLQRQLQIKRDAVLHGSKIDEDWDDSLQSKEQMEANMRSKREAALRRERTLAYAPSRQWKAAPRGAAPTFVDASRARWGWSSLDREPATPRPAVSERSSQSSSRPPSRRSPSMPASPASAAAAKIKPASPQAPVNADRPRRQGYVGSTLRGEQGKRPAPGYMQPTESVRAKSRLHGPASGGGKPETPEKAKKRLSFSVAGDSKSPGRPRRQAAAALGADRRLSR